MRIFLLSLVIPILLSSSCKKQPSDTCKTVLEASKDYLDYWHFPKGSWWVYQLKGAIPAVYDTVTCVVQDSEFYAPGDESNRGVRPCLMVYRSTYKHSNVAYFPYDSKRLEPGLEIFYSQHQEANNHWYLQWVSATGRPDFNIFFKYPFTIDEKLPEGAVFADTNKVITPSYSLNNSVHILYNWPNDTLQSKHIYITKGIGISKVRYSSEEVWELVNYSIK